MRPTGPLDWCMVHGMKSSTCKLFPRVGTGSIEGDGWIAEGSMCNEIAEFEACAASLTLRAKRTSEIAGGFN